MAQDVFTEHSRQGWLSRLGNAIKGVVVGLVLFVVSFVVLFKNEGCAVRSYKTIGEVRTKLVSIAADRVDAAHDGRPVHLAGMATTTATVKDPVFGLSAQAIHLQRTAEMYQWQEKKEEKTEKNLGGSTDTKTTYTYEKTWAKQHIPSSGFKHPEGHQNPERMPYGSERFTAQPVTLGAYQLSAPLVNQMRGAEPLAFPQELLAALPAALQGKARLTADGLYLGNDPAQPQIGDLRLSFSTVKPQTVSIIAQQSGAALIGWTARTGEVFERLAMGEQSSAQMLASAEKDVKVRTWLLRLAGFVLMFIGLSMIFRPLSVLADVVPFIGNLAEFGLGLVAGLIAFSLSALTIAVAWLFYRPLISIPLLLLAIGAVVFVVSKTRRKQA
jgi:hypothetical protein